MKKTTKPRVRVTLLALLWVWAGCMFLVLDLFRNVSEFDSIRPGARFYRAARYAAHKMVGQPYHDADFSESARGVPFRTERAGLARAPVSEAGTRLAAELALVRELEERGSLSGLRKLAARDHDVRVRIAAMRTMATRYGAQVRHTLLEAVHDADETDKLRIQAARLLGRTGPDVLATLDSLLESNLSGAVRAGAVLGYGELGTSVAAQRILSLAAAPPSAMRSAALKAISRTSSAEAAPVLLYAACDASRKPDTRTAACQALARSQQATCMPGLAKLLADQRNPPQVRAAAADTLGRLGQRDALADVAAARNDPAPEVARQARIATTRLAHIKE